MKTPLKAHRGEFTWPDQQFHAPKLTNPYSNYPRPLLRL